MCGVCNCPQNYYSTISPVGRWCRVCVEKDKGIKSWWHPDDKHPLLRKAICRQRTAVSWHDINNHSVLFLCLTTSCSWYLQSSLLRNRCSNVVNKFVILTASQPQQYAHTCTVCLTLLHAGTVSAEQSHPECKDTWKNNQSLVRTFVYFLMFKFQLSSGEKLNFISPGSQSVTPPGGIGDLYSWRHVN